MLPEAPVIFAELESMLLLEAKSHELQFLGAQNPAHLEDFPSVRFEKLTSNNALAGELQGEADCDLANYGELLTQVVELVPVGILGVFVRRALRMVSPLLCQFRTFCRCWYSLGRP